MPLTASGQASSADKSQSFVRVMAAIEGLILAGVLYLVSSVRSQEVSMAELKAAAASYQQAVSAVPALAIEVAQAKRDIAANSNRISEAAEDIKELRNGRAATEARDAKWR